MVITWLSAGGANQFVGYTVPTWYGKGGWGTLGLWVNSCGQLTLAEAFFLNNQQVVKRLLELDPGFRELMIDEETALQITGEKRGQPTPALRRLTAVVGKLKTTERRDAIGLLYDRDSLALYGDPRWEARVDANKVKPSLAWEWQRETRDRWSLKLTATPGHKSEGNLALPLPVRLKQPALTGEAVDGLVLNDEFVLVPNSVVEVGTTLQLKFQSLESLKQTAK
jgi:zinc protease